MKKTFAALAVLGLLAACSPTSGDPAKTAKTSKGDALVDTKGMTLYTYDKDSDGKSACTGPCATNWPPLAASGDAKAKDSYTVISRDDGGKQWAYKGKPLYTFAKDKSAGDVTGDGAADGAWHVAQP
ncbi:putative lipoprotein with Yx(FWY)xxD motif [Rhodoblastus acidophilus]|uniref:COG4315 family predicted lipoprotein n=1 Tax=Rhodoblastus acidophilus TaxID=1074 RepID=UPI0022240A93|nr:hypothetical protein [Rhodoblastus acidophilus]MCW2283616.1 putative lipoprotein with Yx(FWY)xxD motif [Rhodoblastus acidophilus]MCW2332476.1 putative lipoprotein with Yx(FWY)xxD motif [Rhodoblastus acidophilus]